METLDFTNSEYKTPFRKISFFSRCFPTLSFYSRFVPIVVNGSRQAKRRRYGDKEWCDDSLNVLRGLENVGVQVEVAGIENIRGLNTPCVIVANHMGTLETVVLPIIIHPILPMTFVVKQSLLEYPVFKHVMQSRNPIAVGRTNPRQDYKVVLGEGPERLGRGISVVVFPQRTRARSVEPSQFNSIGIKLAKKAGVPVVPLSLLTDAWENGKYIKEFGRINPGKKVYFSFGKPMWVEGRGNDVHQATLDFIVSGIQGFELDD